MKNYFVVLMGALALGGTMTVTEDARAATCDSISCTGKVRVLMAQDNTQDSYVELDSQAAPSGCSLKDGELWVLPAANERAYKLILAAQLAGMPVRLRLKAGVSTCTIAYAQLIT